MAEISVSAVLQQLASALPNATKPYVIVVGSLAAAYQFFGHESNQVPLTTKDLDVMFSPHAKAVVSASAVTEQLLADKWTFRPWGDQFAAPGTSVVPTEELPLVRLLPPEGYGSSDWFLELLGAPAGIPTADERTWKTYHRIETPLGSCALASFGYLAFAQWSPIETPMGIHVARASMMALANLLHHPTVRPDLIGGTSDKRSCKDLGRVLALAYLTMEQDRDGLETWAKDWHSAMQAMCPEMGPDLAQRLGTGLDMLMNSPQDLEQAVRLCALSLLRGRDLDSRGLAGVGRRVQTQIETLQLLF